MKPVLILIAGGSASGKTTVVDKIQNKLNSFDVTIMRHDDYYKNQSDIPMEERLKVNYDHPNALDNDLLYDQLIKLLNNQEIECPTYDFKNHTRSEKTKLIKPTKVIIIEGILILEDKRIRDLADIKLFVESDDDIRFIRRLVRDMNERGRSLENVIHQYLTTVKPMYYAFIKPTKRYADIIIPNDNKHDVAVDVIISKIKDILTNHKDT